MANKEQLSAVIDNELNDSALFDSLEADAELQKNWQDYHLIGDLMRGDVAECLDIDIANKVALAIEQEPAIVAPQTQTKAKPAQNPKVVRFFKYAGQYAIAASVAVAAIIGVQQYSVAPNGEAPLPVFNTIPVGGAVAPVSLQTNQAPRELSEAEILEQRQRIGAYLQDHRFQQRISE